MFVGHPASHICNASPVAMRSVVTRTLHAAVQGVRNLAGSGRGALGRTNAGIKKPGGTFQAPHIRTCPPGRSGARGSGNDGGGGNNGGNSGGGNSGGGDSGPGPMAGLSVLWAAYLQALKAHPNVTKVATSAALNGLGDLIGQTCFESSAFDWLRFVKFTFLGGALVAPVLGVWYSALNGMISAQTTTAALARLALDQFGFAPMFVALFMSTLYVLDGNPQLIRDKLNQDWWPAVKANWTLWLPAQFINFRFVPPSLTLAFSNVIALVWCTYLSWASNRKVKHEQDTLLPADNQP